MGNSMGGMMAWDLAVEHPEKVRKLVLLSSAGYDMEKVSEHVTQVFRYKWIQALLHKGIPKFATKIGVRSCFYDKNFFTEQKLQRVNDFWNIKGNLQVIFDLSNTHKFLDTSLIAKIACPTLILWGRQDNLISYNYADRFHRDIKNSSEIIYDSCGHIPMGEHPLDVERDVRKFFSEK
jgi:pimeloyl-ACP methyl ester carboxylesterase